jgi:hypothetical protein
MATSARELAFRDFRRPNYQRYAIPATFKEGSPVQMLCNTLLRETLPQAMGHRILREYSSARLAFRECYFSCFSFNLPCRLSQRHLSSTAHFAWHEKR